MSQADVDVVRGQFQAVNERDFERAMAIYADDVDLVVTEAWGITAGTYRGKQAVGEWFGDWFRQFSDDYRFEITDARDLGSGRVYVAARHGGSGRASGAPISAESGYLYRVTNGRIDRARLFPSAAAALEAASAPEWSDPENG